MNNILILIAVFGLLAGCSSEKLSNSDKAVEYYSALDISDFGKLRTLIDDSLTIVDGEYATTYSEASFHQQFKWDSIFQTTYKVVEVKEHESQVIVTVSSNSIRYKFLKNNPLICRYKLSFNSKEISKIEALDYIDADWEIWQNQRDSLVKWVSIKHPELDGFIHDLSMNGALDYLKAIELYENR